MILQNNLTDIQRLNFFFKLPKVFEIETDNYLNSLCLCNALRSKR
jgi:hypothetical protein